MEELVVTWWLEGVFWAPRVCTAHRADLSAGLGDAGGYVHSTLWYSLRVSKE